MPPSRRGPGVQGGGGGRGPGGRGQPVRRHSSSNVGAGDKELEEATRSALALAAVAQAASASNRSPAEAAEIAKAQANSIAKRHQARRTGGGGAPPAARPEPRKVQTVNVESVKSLLRSELAGSSGETSPLLEKLAEGENDAFLNQLLLFEYLRSQDTVPEKDDGASPLPAMTSPEDPKNESMKNSYACDRVGLLLSKVELAYDSMVKMLPEVPQGETSDFDDSDSDLDRPVVVPDLLPLCISRPGDATLEFFKACTGNVLEDDEKQETASSVDGTTVTTDLDSNLDQSQKEITEPEKSSSMFSGMFNMKRPNFNKKAFASVFSKKRKGAKHAEEDDEPVESVVNANGEYTVQIEREMLGLTVENVLERTVVRTVLAGGPAKKAGARVGSLIVKVGNIETRNLTHFETIDELRQSQRPLQLILRQISDDALRSAREEMGRLIRGSGFGKVVDGEPIPPPQMGPDGQVLSRPTPTTDRNVDFYTGLVRRRWIEAANMTPHQKKDEPILRVGEKLVWILTLFVVGLERESQRLFALAGEKQGEEERRNSHSQYQHTAKNYAEAAKSVAKVLGDFVKKQMDPVEMQRAKAAAAAAANSAAGRGRGGMGRGGRGGRGRGGRGMVMPPQDDAGEKLLLAIGDVLQRTRTFLADPTSPPAALLRGEVISCLCDILDADTEMKLSEEESASSTQGGSAGPITDLGSAGSLLKLIVLNCPIMRSPMCEEISAQDEIDEEEIKRRFGYKKEISGADIHRLHAGNRFLAVVHRLAASRSTSARITACSLGPVLWSHLDFPHQLQVSHIAMLRHIAVVRIVAFSRGHSQNIVAWCNYASIA